MARKLASGRLVIASHNPGKAREIAELLAGYPIDVVSLAELHLPEPEETGASFRANAKIKARAAARAANLPALGDDSGLTIPALRGAPGILSARWAGEGRDFTAAMARVEREMAGKADRAAAFACALALCWPDGICETVEGSVEGHLVFPPRGTRGFGYDPIFRPDGFDVTFGEMEPGMKHRISHRAVAFRKLARRCFAAPS
jgi:XTP/dITP diphosphohydrolase